MGILAAGAETCDFIGCREANMDATKQHQPQTHGHRHGDAQRDARAWWKQGATQARGRVSLEELLPGGSPVVFAPGTKT